MQSHRARDMLHTRVMWTAKRRKIEGREGEIVSVAEGEHMLTMREVISLWRDDEAFRDFFIATLAASPYAAFFWEMPPLDDGALVNAYECAVIGGDVLARMRSDDSDFSEHLCGPEQVAVFDNLGGDALLIAPRQIADAESYGHIASFVRHAPREQQHWLLRCLAAEIEKRLANSQQRFWVSTSGLGVPWVHVRLDRRPKYYQYAPYKTHDRGIG